MQTWVAVDLEAKRSSLDLDRSLQCRRALPRVLRRVGSVHGAAGKPISQNWRPYWRRSPPKGSVPAAAWCCLLRGPSYPRTCIRVRQMERQRHTVPPLLQTIQQAPGQQLHNPGVAMALNLPRKSVRMANRSLLAQHRRPVQLSRGHGHFRHPRLRNSTTTMKTKKKSRLVTRRGSSYWRATIETQDAAQRKKPRRKPRRAPRIWSKLRT